jgi:hypothetical protein
MPDNHERRQRGPFETVAEEPDEWVLSYKYVALFSLYFRADEVFA